MAEALNTTQSFESKKRLQSVCWGRLLVPFPPGSRPAGRAASTARLPPVAFGRRQQTPRILALGGARWACWRAPASCLPLRPLRPCLSAWRNPCDPPLRRLTRGVEQLRGVVDAHRHGHRKGVVLGSDQGHAAQVVQPNLSNLHGRQRTAGRGKQSSWGEVRQRRTPRAGRSESAGCKLARARVSRAMLPSQAQLSPRQRRIQLRGRPRRRILRTHRPLRRRAAACSRDGAVAAAAGGLNGQLILNREASSGAGCSGPSCSACSAPAGWLPHTARARRAALLLCRRTHLRAPLLTTCPAQPTAREGGSSSTHLLGSCSGSMRTSVSPLGLITSCTTSPLAPSTCMHQRAAHRTAACSRCHVARGADHLGHPLPLARSTC